MFEELFRELSFSPTKIFRQGPRVYVAGGRYQGQRAIFKSSLPTSQNVTSEHLYHEALFLESAPRYLDPFVPKVFRDGSEGGQSWYLVEWVWPGKAESIGKSDFLILSKFFTQDDLHWSLEVLAALRRFSSQIPDNLKQEFAHTSYDLFSYRGLLELQGGEFFDRRILGRVKGWLDEAESIYNRLNTTTITHHEFYGSQILTSGKTLKLTDWENVGWGHPLRDFTSLWVRAFEHPAWQKKFLQKFKEQLIKEQKLTPEEFEVLFGVEKILQNFGNLVHFDQTDLPEERRRGKQAMEFFRRCVLDTLGN